MTDKDNSTDTSGSMTSSLSDSWSLVNTHGDLMDEDSCSTTSSVEVVEEEEEGDSSLYSSQHTSLGTTPTGPLFVLRLPSHDVSDTDDDQIPGGTTQNATNSESFDILSDCAIYRAGKAVKPGNLQVNSDVSSDYSGSSKEDLTSDQGSPPSPEVEEQVLKYVQALQVVENNLQTKRNGNSSSVLTDNLNEEHLERDISSKDIQMSKDIQDSETNVEFETSVSTVPAQIVVETIGTSTPLITADLDSYIDSSYSHLDTDKEAGHDIKDSQKSSDVTLVNQSMEKMETPGNQQYIDHYERVEPAKDISDQEAEHETENQPTRHCQTWGRLKGLWRLFRPKLTIESLVCIVVVLSMSTYFTLRALEDKNMISAEYLKIQDELKSCQQSEESLKMDVWQKDMSYAVSLQEASKILRHFANTSDENFPSEVDRYLTDATTVCEAGQGHKDCEREMEQTTQTLNNKIKVLTSLLKRVINFNKGLREELQVLEQENESLKESLLENKQEEQTAWTGGDGESSGEEGGKTEDDVLFDKCLNVMMHFYQQKYNEKYQWFEMGSDTMREYLSGYLFDTIPDNMRRFFERMNNGGTQPTDAGNTDRQETSQSQNNQEFNNRQNNQGPKNDERQDKTEDTRYSDSSNGQQKKEEFWSGYTGSEPTNWANKVIEMMNKTRNQLQDTWQQVKNVSEKMWTKHEPAITKLQNSFIKKLKRVSDKFQEKFTKKVNRWFNRAGKRKQEDYSESTFGDGENMARTERRRDRRDENQMKHPTEKPYTCSREVIQVRDSIINLNAKKYKKLTDDDDLSSRRILKKLKQIMTFEDVPDTSLVKTWLQCQIDWWSFNHPKPLELPQYLVSEKCFDSVECWQIEVSEGRYGNGKKKCQQLRRAHVNVMAEACDDTVYNSNMEEDTVSRKPHTSAGNKQHGNTYGPYKDSVRENHRHTEPDDDDDDDDVDDVIDDANVEENDEEIENWYVRRAEERDYHHTEPDNWYFRRHKKPVKHDCEP